MSVDSPDRPLVITSDPELREELERLCAATGLVPHLVARPDDARCRWSSASCVLIGEDAAEVDEPADVQRRRRVVLVTTDAGLSSWQRAVAIRADAVVELPSGRAGLADLLADCAEVEGPTGQVVAVVGATGGVGASTVAAKLGLVAARRGHTIVLVDADPYGGGLDLLLGCESTPGLRWPDVAAVNGRVTASALRSALPSTQGVAVLSWSAGAPARVSGGTARAIVTAAKRGSELVIVDLARHLDVESELLLAEADTALVVSGCDVRSVAAVARLTEVVGARCRDLRLVVRSDVGGGIDPRQVASAVDLPIAATTRRSPRSARAVDDGLGPVVGRRDRRDLGRVVADVLNRTDR